MANEKLTSDKVAPLLKKPEAVILLVNLYSVIAAKVSKGVIEHLSVARGIDQKENAQKAFHYLKANTSRLSKNLVIATHEVALTSVPISFGNDISLADANQALVWQLNEIIGDIFPTPTIQQVVDSAQLLNDEKYTTWQNYVANAGDSPNAEQALRMLDLLDESDIERIQNNLDFITPQSLEQLHLGWRPVSTDETAVFAIKKDLRQNWLTYAKDNKLKLTAILPLTIPSKEIFEGKKSHYSKITPAKISTYYFEKGQLKEVRDHPRQNQQLPSTWLNSLNDPGESSQIIYCSRHDGELVKKSIPNINGENGPYLAAGDASDELTLENIITFATISPDKRSLPFISPLEPLAPLKFRRIPYYAAAAIITLLISFLTVSPKIKNDRRLDDRIASLKLQKRTADSEISILSNRQKEVNELNSTLVQLRNKLDRALLSDKATDQGDFTNATHHWQLLRSLSNSIASTQITLESFSSDNQGKSITKGSGTSVTEIQQFVNPFLQSQSALGMPAHTMDLKKAPELFGFKFTVGPQQ